MRRKRSYVLVLMLALTMFAPAGEAADKGFLKGRVPDAAKWLPPAPTDGPDVLADMEEYLADRHVLGEPRGVQAQNDDVYAPEPVAERFHDALALGVPLTAKNAGAILTLIGTAQEDLESVMETVKIPPEKGGRTRPYVAFPSQPACRHEESDAKYHMATTGSYPSMHAAIGMLWAEMLVQLFPERSEAIFDRGYQFGESRLVCGFHYNSDLVAGRMVASFVVARLQADRNFQKSLKAAQRQASSLSRRAGH
ncbi:phosphatase PAP2 family protein [Luteibacter aegosomatis]|uniref:phosphatase PAP2 family protein n=1 Tax=Luteibacter aegosomatis TaxID=2911537 RepID=UPI001FFBAC5E|nr:phosphatase PAP2 family protein [Luteibacter aegosomatis]UPG86731.1 phosphatase PAP2 family protein [Luteibacter aegosomatis]